MPKLNLVKLCLKLSHDFTTNQLRAISSELGIDADEIGLNNPALRMEAVISLVARIDGEARIGDLLDVCARQGSNVDWLESTQFIPVTWTPKTVPHDIVEKVNVALALAGKPYLILGTPSYENNWAPVSIPTGCFCWRLEVKIPVLEDFGSAEEYVEHIMYPSLDSIPDLEKVRGLLVNEPVTVYIGSDCQWGQFGASAFPCIVVASTLDQFDVVRIEKTTAGNYALDADELIAELMPIDQRYGIDIIAADVGSIEFRLKRIPEGQEESYFRQWLHDLAPDIDSTDSLKYPIKLGWD